MAPGGTVRGKATRDMRSHGRLISSAARLPDRWWRCVTNRVAYFFAYFLEFKKPQIPTQIHSICDGGHGGLFASFVSICDGDRVLDGEHAEVAPVLGGHWQRSRAGCSG